MRERDYYSIRKGFANKEALGEEMFKKAFLLKYNELVNKGYFQKYFGGYCIDSGEYSGLLGEDIPTAIFLKIGKNGLWPVHEKYMSYSDVDLLTIIEFLHDCCSEPTESHYHSYGDCGIHVHKADDELGHKMFRNEINPLLKRYLKVELSVDGEILEDIEEGFDNLFKADLPTTDEQNIKQRVQTAMLKFRRAKSGVDERRDALRDLADVVEFLKPQISSFPISKDTNELFQIANTFGIRHHNPHQKTDYDKPIWHSWMFYCYLSTIHLFLRLIEDQKKNP